MAMDMSIQTTRYTGEAWLLNNHEEMPNGSQEYTHGPKNSKTKEMPRAAKILVRVKRQRFCKI